MKFGIIGLGNIARKAYLPVLANKEGIELAAATRNEEVLKLVTFKYKIKETVRSVEELIKLNIEAAFVHSSTDSHYAIVKKLLASGIHVYVDKPISYNYNESQELVSLAESKGLILMTGFNRRFAPMYRSLKAKPAPKLIIMQKNRVNLPGEVREFIYDDFIHVVDTILFLAPDTALDTSVTPFFRNKELTGVSANISGQDFSSLAVMYRDNGITEETLEFITEGEKFVVKELNETFYFSDGEEKKIKFGNWDYVLYRRGFFDITDYFIKLVRDKNYKGAYPEDTLRTHRFCEDIVSKIISELNIRS